MFNLSSFIITAINSSLDYKWQPDNWQANRELIDIGFDNYLEQFGISLQSKPVNGNMVPLS